MKYFDSHAHFDLPVSDDASARRIRGCAALEVGVCAIFVPAVHPNRWAVLEALPASLGVGHAWPKLYYGLGIHPYAVAEMSETAVTKELQRLTSLAKQPSSAMRALGECGLHFTRELSDTERKRQIFVFAAQLELARRCDTPLVIHCVGAHGLVTKMLDAAPTPPCVLHAYSGSVELALHHCRKGRFVGFGAEALRSNAKRAPAVLARVPSERILIETDSPDPRPRGQPGWVRESSELPDIAAALARLRGVALDEFAESTTLNAYRAYGLPASKVSTP